jgi:hypothetical protein
MATRVERRVSSVFERRRYRRGGRRREDLQDEESLQARVNDVASELAHTSGFENESSVEWADFTARDVEAALSALKQLQP